MKVLLISPSCHEIYGRGAKSEGILLPLGLAYIGSYLRENDVSVSAVDAEAEGLSDEMLSKRITQEKPDLVGISTTTPTIYLAVKVSKLVKSIVLFSTTSLHTKNSISGHPIFCGEFCK